VYIKDLLLRIRTSNCLGNEGLWDVKIEDFFETVDAGELLRVPNFGPTSLKDLCLAMLTKKVVTKTAMREWLKTARYVPIKTWGCWAMTTYWTVLAITFIVNGEMMTSKLLFPTMKSCGAAMNVLYYDHIQTHFKESMAQCIKSTLTSNKLTRMPRLNHGLWLEK
jgi:hypothetical protein